MSEPTSSATGRSSPAPASSIVLPPGGWSNDRATSDGRVGLSGSADPGGPPAVAAITSDPSTGVACGTGPAEKMSELSTGGGASNRSAGRTSSGADVGAAGAPDGGPASSHPDAGATGGSRFPRSISEPSSRAGRTRIPDPGPAGRDRCPRPRQSRPETRFVVPNSRLANRARLFPPRVQSLALPESEQVMRRVEAAGLHTRRLPGDPGAFKPRHYQRLPTIRTIGPRPAPSLQCFAPPVNSLASPGSRPAVRARSEPPTNFGVTRIGSLPLGS